MRINAVHVAAVIVAAAVGCGTPHARAEAYTWRILAPKSVQGGKDLSFQVTTTNRAGQDEQRVKYKYVIAWPDGDRSARHSGKSGVGESPKTRKQPGTATLIIYTEDAAGNDVKATETTFEIK